MATSTCIKCGKAGSFEFADANIQDANAHHLFVQCAACGGVVGVVDSENITAMLKRQNAALEKIATVVGAHVSLTTL